MLEGVNPDVSLNAENSTALILSTRLWVSVLTVANFKKKLDWPKLRATIIYGGKQNYWEGNMASCAFSSARIPLGPLNCLVRGFWTGLQYLSWIFSCEEGIKANQKVIVYPHNSHDTITPASASCLTCGYCSSQDSYLGKTVCWWRFSLRSFHSTFWRYES